MKNKWLIPVILFIVLVLGYVVRGIFQTRISVEMLQTDKIEESSSGQGVLVKSETTNSVPIAGVAEIYVKNGQRVSNGQLLVAIYGGTTDESVRTQLADVNKKINAIKESHSGDAVFVSDATKIESEISENVDAVILNVAEHDMESMSEYKHRISTLADQKAVAKGDKQGFSDSLTQLQAEKSALEAKLGKIETVAKATSPGIFIEGNDGFENTLVPNEITSLTPTAVNDVILRDKNNEIPENDGSNCIYKIVDNYKYYVAINLEESFCKDMQVGDSIIVRFSDFSNGECPAKVVYISDETEKDKKTVVAQCDTYVQGLMSKRVVNVDFVKKSVTGYKVKVEHLHTVDNAVGLFIKRGAVMKFIPVSVIYSTEDEAIVSAASSEKPIKSYDEVVTSAPEYYDGRVIVSQ